MGEKYYKPVLKKGKHLLDSKDHPDRKRGLARDDNNKNQDIVEWEEYDIEDLQNTDYGSYSYERNEYQLSEEQEELAQMIGEALGAAIITGGIVLVREVIAPWFRSIEWPWTKKKKDVIRSVVSTKAELKVPAYEMAKNKRKKTTDLQNPNITAEIDEAFEKIYFDMDEEEAKEHMMRLVYHMLGVVNEIRIISNARIRKGSKSKKICAEQQKEMEMLLAEKVAVKLDQLLSNDSLHLDLNTSRDLFQLTGGGVHLNGEYVPVQTERILEAMYALPAAGE